MSRASVRPMLGALTALLIVGCSEPTPAPASAPTGTAPQADPEPGTEPETEPLIRPHLFRTGDGHVGVALEIEEGWHVYWRNPGDAGLPTQIEWSGADVEFGPTLYPAPERFTGAGDVTSFGYENTVAMFARRAADDGRVTAEVSWLACRESCIKGGETLAGSWTELPVEPHPEHRGRVPLPLPRATVPTWEDQTVTLTLPGPIVEFFPLDTEPAFIDSVATEGAQLRLSYRRTGTASPSRALGVATIRGPEGPMIYEVTAEWPSS